ncbi:plexin-D1, partial [Clarias magur]
SRKSRPEGRMPPSSESLSVATRALLLAVPLLLASRCVCALHVQQSFETPSETNNFVVDAVSGQVYLAAVNAIYQLNGTLAKEVSNSTGPVRDNVLCHAPQLPQAPCEHTKSLTDNHNKLLALDREQGVLVACGSVYQGFCELRRMDNVSQIAVEFPKPNATVFPSMLNIVANHPNASTVGLVFRSQGGTPRLLVAATYTGLGTDYFPKNHSKEDLRFENTPEIAIRSLNTKDLARLFTYDINPSEDNVFKIKQEVKPKHKLSFVHVFAQKTYSYIAMNNDANSGFKESQPNSILARICLDTDTPRRQASEGRKLTESYIQMGLQCGASGNIYNRLVSIFPADIKVQDQPAAEPYLFGVFAKSNRKSALCAFRVAEIEETIRQGRRNCSNGPNGDVQVLDSVIQGSGAECEAKGNIVLQPEQLNCGAAHLQHPLALRKPIRSEPLYEATGISSVAVDNIHNYTVVFLGTSNGRLRKLSLLRNLSVANQWSLRLPAGEPVHHVMTFDTNDRNYLYLMTSHHLLRVRVSGCAQYTTCSDCLNASDAYCGWCTLESRCSVQQECSSGVAHSWISMGEGPQQCPSMTFTPAEFSRTSDVKNLGILVNGSVPDLTGLRLECYYGPGMVTVATVHLDSSPAKIQTCPLPPPNNFPKIPLGSDHISVPVAIKVNGTSVVSGSFVIYDCERTAEINPRTACTSCLNTKWKCYWDHRRNMCISDKDKFGSDVFENAENCPRITTKEIPPSPTGMTQEITLHLNNVDQDTELNCDFGNGQLYQAHWLRGPSAVKCTVTLSTSRRSETFQLDLRRRGQDKYIDSPEPIKVEVYSCSGGDSDCSQCWGREQQGHLCAWCDNSCRPRDQCQPMKAQCPDPTIHKITPLSGPVTGGTLLTVHGRNLGRRVGEVEVFINAVPCQMVQHHYTVSVKLVCMTGESSGVINSKVEVRVNGTAIGYSTESFSYVEPRLDDLNPVRGPIAGGTRLTIRGKFLDAGSAVKVKVNSTQDCEIDRLLDDLIECVMPPAVPDVAENVTVCVEYDGRSCDRRLSGVFFYEKNPVINSVKPNKSYLSGGREISVIGQSFDLVQTAAMHVVGIGQS